MRELRLNKSCRPVSEEGNRPLRVASNQNRAMLDQLTSRKTLYEAFDHVRQKGGCLNFFSPEGATA
jgi:hypothetical protein